MTLQEFKTYIETSEQSKLFNYGISEPFSWRGSYDEVAFELIEQPTTREDVLANIQKAYDGTFSGWKGGEYTYQDDTEVHFEEDKSSYTAGGYCAAMIEKIDGDQEMKLVELAFS